jgi:Cu/Ag efflux protein CusF
MLLVSAATPLWAEEVSGKIQKVDTSDRSIVLEDGTQLWLAESVSADALKEGATVKASYEEKDGKKVVTQIEVSQ